MTAIYEAGNIPFISSAAIGAKFTFKAIRFLCDCRTLNIQRPIDKKCGNSADVRSDRTLEMEMQLLGENENHSLPTRFLIFSWLFVLSNKSKNYSLEPLIKCLKFIRRPNTMKTIKSPFPLDRIVYESAGNNYYGYMDDCVATAAVAQLYHPDESHHQFIEANHLIPIGITQMREFHKLAAHHHRIECCAVNKSVRIENRHSSNAQHQMDEKELKQNADKTADGCERDEQLARHSAIQTIRTKTKSR